jgi:hypothetical protein
MAERARREDRETDIGAGSASDMQQEGARRQFADIELGALERTPEHLFRRHGHEFEPVPLDADRAVEQAARAVEIAARDRQGLCICRHRSCRRG